MAEVGSWRACAGGETGEGEVRVAKITEWLTSCGHPRGALLSKLILRGTIVIAARDRMGHGGLWRLW